MAVRVRSVGLLVFSMHETNQFFPCIFLIAFTSSPSAIEAIDGLLGKMMSPFKSFSQGESHIIRLCTLFQYLEQ